MRHCLLSISVSHQLHWGWREEGHWPNICQVFLRTALMGSINRASFCFIFRYFLIRDENSDHCSLRAKIVLPRVPGSCCCSSLFAVSQETSTTTSRKIRSFLDLSPWLALCFCPDASCTGNTSMFQSLAIILNNKIKLHPIVSCANKGNVSPN